MASIASNAVTLGRFLNVSPGVLIKLMNTSDVNLSDKQKSLKLKVIRFLAVKGTSFNASVPVIHMPPIPPSSPQLPTAALAKLVSAAGFELVNSITDIRPGKVGVYTGTYAVPTLPVNNWALMSIMQAGPLYKKHEEIIKHDLTECTLYVVSGGSEEALLKRMTAGFTSDIPVTPPDWWSDDETFFSTLSQVLPWEDRGTSDLSEDGLHDNTYVVNVTSSYGLPYPDSLKRDVIVTKDGEVSGVELMITQAQKLLDILVEGEDALSTYVESKEGRPFFAALIKNKVELMKRTDVTEKTRPYFNFSAPLTWLFGQIFAAYSDGVPTFPYHPSSISLIGFSWVGGGAELLVQAIRNLPAGSSLIFCYADDFVVIARAVDGTVYMAFPDLRQMDLHIRKVQTDKFAMFVRFCLSETDSHFPNAYDKVLCVWQEIAVRAEIVFAKSVTARPKSGRLLSGITGTSRVDEFVSANIIVQCKMQKIFDDLTDQDSFSAALEEFAIIALEQGQEVKPDTLGVQVFVDGETIEGPILGQSLVFDPEMKIYVPRPQSWRCLATLIYPKTAVRDGMARVSYSMIQALGVAVSGGVFYEHVYDICAAIWTQGKEKGAIPSADVISAQTDVGFEGIDYVSMVFGVDGVVKDFPTKAEIRNLFSQDYKAQPETSDQLTDEYVDKLLEELGQLDQSKWGDAEEIELKEKSIKTGGRPVPPETKPPKPADVRSGYRISLAPATHAPGQKPEDKELRKRKDAKFEAAKAATAAKKAQVKSVSKEGFTKKELKSKRWVETKNSEASGTDKPKHQHRTVAEKEEEEEHKAQQATGISKTREKLLVSRRVALEKALLDPSLDATTINRHIDEIESIDKSLGRT